MTWWSSMHRRSPKHWWVLVSKAHEISIRTDRRNQIIDITEKIRKIVNDSGVEDGIASVFVLHTTAAITINENADPSVKSDMLGFLEHLIPQDAGFRHSEDNSDAHIKSSLVGPQVSVTISNGELVLGTWQGIYFCEFDGPRSRRVIVKVLSD
jgi:secondary thiamine-phosphate synthase enzyme